jgi:predicted DNA-binding protein
MNDYLRIEDLEDIYIADKRLAEIRSGRAKPIPLEEVMRQFGLKKTAPSGRSRTRK